MSKEKRQTHNYTSELELKTLLIRVKNSKFKDIKDEKYNKSVNKYVKWFNSINEKKYNDLKLVEQRKRLKKVLKEKAIRLSESTGVDNNSYERFGEIILLMIKKILTKGQFSGYTYKDEFYSDASHKILKYLHNFDHTLISKRSGQFVNAFAYISQIIHNSVVFIIKQNNKLQKDMKKQISYCSLDHGLDIKNEETNNLSQFKTKFESEDDNEYITIDHLSDSLYNTIINENFIQKAEMLSKINKHLVLIYPGDYRISIDEYSKLKSILKNISIQREKEEECTEE